MIIGPNGTGKSSLVCAIALGLGWKPAVLGRQKDVAAFVKNGYDDGAIELELKAKKDSQPNVVIERRIFKRDNKSEWRLNGARATAKDIQDKVNEFNIAIGNLCCFLPQDKVADFAKMNPTELLRETQKAAGPEGMTAWHDKLVQLGAEQKELGVKLNIEREEVTNLEQRNSILGREVQRAEDRDKVEQEIALLELRVPYAQYERSRAKWSLFRDARNKRKSQLKQHENTLKPLQTKLTTMGQENHIMGAEISAIQKKILSDTNAFKSLHRDLEKQETESQDISDSLSSLRKQKDGRRGVIQSLERQIGELEEAVKVEPPRPDYGDIDPRIRSIKDDLRRIKSELGEQSNAYEEISSDVRHLDGNSDRIRLKLIEMDNVKAARLEVLRRADPASYEAVMWLRENAGLFREKVYEPVMVEISVEDSKFASAVEASINFATMKTFVCQTREDYDLFTRNLVDGGKRLRLNVVELEGGKSLEAFRNAKPTTEEELRHFGFDRYLVDCVDGPAPVLQYLCETSHLHAVPYATDEKRIKVEDVERSGKFRRYITGTSMSTITLSNYGNRLPQVLTRNLRPARTLINSVDQNAKRQLEREKQEIGEKKAQLEENSRELTRQEIAMKKSVEQLRRQQMDLEQEKGAMQAPRSKWEKMVVNLNSKKEALMIERNKPSVKEREDQLMRSWTKVNDKSRVIIMQIMKLMKQQVTLRTKLDKEVLKQLQHQHKIETLTTLKTQQEEQYSEAKQALDEGELCFAEQSRGTSKTDDGSLNLSLFTSKAVIQLAAVKKEAEALLAKLTKRQEEVNTETIDAFQALDQDEASSVEQLEDLLAEEKAKLSAMIEVRPGVMQEFNERKRKIEEMNATITHLIKDKGKVDARVEKYASKWKVALQELVDNVSQRFSRAFESTGNAGEVQLLQHEDYDKWGIGIMVKFRDGEKLQLLTASRQSGGERSISTITYLLSLTEMSRSPFSLVDEINQGMDQKYERQVHDHMVNVTCRESAGQ